MRRRRWLFADQLGLHHLDAPDQPVLLVESRGVLRRRRFHRAKAQLLLSGVRHLARDLGEQAVFLQVESYEQALAQVAEPLDVVQPTSRAADRFVRARGLPVLPPRGFVTSREQFDSWAEGRRGRLLMEDFYRWQRTRLRLLMDGEEPAGGRWNFDHDNREPPPKQATLGVPEPWRAVEDDVDAQVRSDPGRHGTGTEPVVRGRRRARDPASAVPRRGLCGFRGGRATNRRRRRRGWTVVDDSDAPSLTVIADQDGNTGVVCVAVSPATKD